MRTFKHEPLFSGWGGGGGRGGGGEKYTYHDMHASSA